MEGERSLSASCRTVLTRCHSLSSNLPDVHSFCGLYHLSVISDIFSRYPTNHSHLMTPAFWSTVRIEDSSCEIRCVSGHLPFSQPPTTLVTIVSRVPTPLTPYRTATGWWFFEQTEHSDPGAKRSISATYVCDPPCSGMSRSTSPLD